MPSELAIPQTWQVAPLSDLTAGTTVTYGVVQPGANVTDGIPMLRVNNFRGFGLDTFDVLRIAPEIESKYGRTRLRAGDVLITIVGSVGQVAIVPKGLEGWNIARAVALVRPKVPSMARWIALFLRSPVAQHALGVAANTTVQTTINLKDLKQLSVPIPPKEELEGIAATLSALDDKIALLRETNATLEAIAQALFKSWFVDFDPVRAKAEGRDPEGVPPEVADLFPSEFEDSELGEIPKGWRVGKLGEISRNLRVGAKPEELTDDTAYIGLEHMPRQSIALEDWESASKVESGKSRFRKGQILFGKLRPYFHKVGIAPLDGVCSTDILVIEPSSPAWHAVCVCHYSSKALIEHATQLSNGAKMPRTNWSDLANYRIVVPPDEVAQAFEDIVSPLLSRIPENVHGAKTLAETRDALLPRLMSGKLRIPEIQEAIEEATA